MPVEFSFWPALLLLVPVLPFLYWQHRRSITDLSPARRRLALAIRTALVTLLVLVISGARLQQLSQSLAVIFLADGSRSIRNAQRFTMEKYIREAAAGRRHTDTAGLITFARDPHLVSSPGQPLESVQTHDPGVTTATNIAQALRQAQSELESTARGSAKRIVLLSDGDENEGRALAESSSLASRGITLDTVTIPPPSQPEALIDRVAVPARARIGEPYQVKLVVDSTVSQSAVIGLTRDGLQSAASRRVQLHTGRNVVSFEQSIDRTGFFRYDAQLDAAHDSIPENNRGEGYVWVKGKPTVLYVADDPSLTSFLRSALSGQNIDVEYAPAAALPTSAAALQKFDSIFLSNVRASDLSLAQMGALETACRDFGIGFGLVGGENSFGAGGYRGTPLEETLPVSLEVKKQTRIPSVAVVLVIEDLEVNTSVNMSIEAAKATIDLLEPIDMVGVLDCNGIDSFGAGSSTLGGTWRIPMQHVTDRTAIKTAMQNLTNMGDPPSYAPFFAEAARTLNGTDAKVKHIVFLGDGDAIYESKDGSSVAHSLAQIRKMGITVSTITTGATGQRDLRFMAALAYAGGGQAYEANRPEDLPRLLLKDQETFSQPPIVEEPFQARPVDGDEVLKGLDWGAAPPLLGYNISTLKPTASQSLVSHRGDPVFASWRFGLGRSVAFLSDDRAKWAAQWVGWQGYAKFWAQAVRWTLRPFKPGSYSAEVTRDGDRGHIVLDAIDPEGKFVNGLHLTARVAAPGAALTAGPSTDTILHESGPGRYEAWFEAGQSGTYLVNVLDRPAGGGAMSSTVLGLSTAYPLEYRDILPNRTLMAQLAAACGGRVDPPASAVFGGERPAVYNFSELARKLLLLSLFLLPLDVAIRRLAVNRRDLALLMARAARKSPVPEAVPEAGQMDRLARRKAGTVLNEPSPYYNGTVDSSESIHDESGSVTETPSMDSPDENVEVTERAREESFARLRAAKDRARRQGPDDSGASR